MKFTITIDDYNSQIEAIIQLIKATDNIDIIEDYTEIPQSHKDLAIKRYNESKENPDIMLDWNEAKKAL